jgi:hypothetical protein
MAPSGPTRRGAAGKETHRSAGRGPIVLTDLLTTALDYPGPVRNEKPREQGRRDRLATMGRVTVYGTRIHVQGPLISKA